MRISDWSSDVCSSDLYNNVEYIDQTIDHQHADDQPIGATECELWAHKQTVQPAQQQQGAAHRITGAHHKRNGAQQKDGDAGRVRSEEHTSELQSLMRISYAVFCLKKKTKKQKIPK